MSLLKKVYRKAKQTAKKHLDDYKFKSGGFNKSKIVRPETCGENVYTLKEPTIEHVPINKVYGFITDGSFSVEYPQINLWKFKKATVIGRTDFVFLESGDVYWKKYFAYNYSKNFPLDRLYYCEKDGYLYTSNPKCNIQVETAFSLLGVHAQIWSHSLSEYFTKISVLGKAIDDCKSKVTVLVPNYTDQQLKQVMYSALDEYKEHIEILVVEDEVAVKAETLYYIDRPTTFTDHEYSVSLGDDVQPKIVADIIKEKLVSPMLSKIDSNREPIKLYLPRRGFGRNVTNFQELEDFFRSEGFVFMEEPHKLSLDEKIAMFNSADVIVGPFGSAFSNIIFCKPNTKMLLFSNFSRHYEAWLCMHQKYFNLDLLWVTGYDDKSSHNLSHCSYYVPIEKVKAAYKQLLND